MTASGLLRPTTSDGSVARLYRYPVKGLSPEKLGQFTVIPGRGLPGDREWAFARPETIIDENNLVPLPKTRFLTLARDSELARLRVTYDEASRLLTVRDGASKLVVDLGTDGGRRAAEKFIADIGIASLDRQVPKLVRAFGGHRFTDAAVHSTEYMHALSMVNLASIDDVSRRIGVPVHHLRFRANIYLRGFPPWEEDGWIGRSIRLGDLRARVLEKTVRCPATSVNPTNAERDVDLPGVLREHFGRNTLGLYLSVSRAGTTRQNDLVVVER